MTGPSTFKELKQFIDADLSFEQTKKRGLFLRRYLFEAGFKYVFWLRVTRYFFLKEKFWILAFAISRFMLKHYGYKYTFDISYRAEIGKGLQIAHYGYVTVPSGTVMGEYCRLRPGVVIGRTMSHDNNRLVIIGNRVEFGVGSKVIGAERVGNNVTIGANAVVTKSMPDNCTVAGMPAKVIRYKDVPSENLETGNA